MDVYKLLGDHLYEINDILHYYQVNQERYTFYTQNKLIILDKAIILSTYINNKLYEQTNHCKYIRSSMILLEVRNIIVSKDIIYKVIPKINNYQYSEWVFDLSKFFKTIPCNPSIFFTMLQKYILYTYGWKTVFYKTNPFSRIDTEEVEYNCYLKFII